MKKPSQPPASALAATSAIRRTSWNSPKFGTSSANRTALTLGPDRVCEDGVRSAGAPADTPRVRIVLQRPAAARLRPPVAWVAVLVWCAVCGYFAFVRSQRVPLVSLADLGFHELGHLVMYVFPINQILTAAMGSVMQIAVPLGLATYFGWYRRDSIALVACLAWAATNFQDASVYIADAPYQRLELIGGEHDWAYVLGTQGLHRMHQAAQIASTVRNIGLLILIVAIGLGISGLVRSLSTPAPVPDGARAATPDDLWPTTSRTPSSDPDLPNRRW